MFTAVWKRVVFLAGALLLLAAGSVWAQGSGTWDFTSAQVTAGANLFSQLNCNYACHGNFFPQLTAGFGSFENLSRFIQNEMPGLGGGDNEGYDGPSFRQTLSEGQAEPPFSNAPSDVGNAIEGRNCWPACHRSGAPTPYYMPISNDSRLQLGEYLSPNESILSWPVGNGPYTYLDVLVLGSNLAPQAGVTVNFNGGAFVTTTNAEGMAQWPLPSYITPVTGNQYLISIGVGSGSGSIAVQDNLALQDFSISQPTVSLLPDGRYRLSMVLGNQDGSAAGNLKVGIVSSSSPGPYSRYTYTDSAGRITFDELPGGFYTLPLPLFTPAEAQDLAAYVLNSQGIQPGAPLASPNTQALGDPGAGLFQTYCAGCHGKEGVNGPGPRLVGAFFGGLAQAGPNALAQFIAENMPPGEPNLLSPAQISAIVNFLYDLNGLPLPGNLTLASPLPESTRSLYLKECSACHGADGTGVRVHRPGSGLSLPIAGSAATTLTDYPTYSSLESFLEAEMLPLARDPDPSVDAGPLTAYVEYLNGNDSYLTQVTPSSAPPVPQGAGAELYRAFCSSCHGLDARGGLLAPPLVFGRYYSRNYIVENMPPGWGGVLTLHQADLIARFIDRQTEADDNVRTGPVPRRLREFNRYCSGCHNGEWGSNLSGFSSSAALANFIWESHGDNLPQDRGGAVANDLADLLWNFQPNAAVGQSLYALDCASCHGSPTGGTAPPLWGSAATWPQDEPTFGSLVEKVLRMLPYTTETYHSTHYTETQSETVGGYTYTLTISTPGRPGSHGGVNNPFFGELTLNGSPLAGQTISYGYGGFPSYSTTTDSQGRFSVLVPNVVSGSPTGSSSFSYTPPGGSALTESFMTECGFSFNDNPFLQPAVDIAGYLYQQEGLSGDRQANLSATLTGPSTLIETEPASYTLSVSSGGTPFGGNFTVVGPGFDTPVTVPDSGSTSVTVTIPAGQPTGSASLTVLNQNGTVIGSLPVTVEPAPVPTTIADVSVSPTPALTEEELTVTGVVYDQYGDPVAPGTNVSLTASGGYVLQGSTTTGSGGSFSFAPGFLTVSAGTYTLTITAGGASTTYNLNVAANPYALSLAPTSVAAGSTTSLTGTLTLNGSAVPDGTSLTLSASAGSISSPVSTSGGSFSTDFTAPTTPQTVFVTADWSGGSLSVPETVTAGPVSQVVWSNITAHYSSGYATATATAEDAYGNLVSGSVTLTGQVVNGYQTEVSLGNGNWYTSLTVNFNGNPSGITIYVTTTSSSSRSTAEVIPYVNGQAIPQTLSTTV